MTSNAGNATNHYWIDTIDDVDIWVKSINSETYAKLAVQYGDGFKQLVAKYSNCADDVIELTTKYGDDFITLINTNQVPESSIKKLLTFKGDVKEIDELFATGRGKKHFSSYDGFDKNSNGIQGCHVLDELNRLENIDTVAQNERLIKIIHSEEISEDIYKVHYVIAKQDGKGGYVVQPVNGKYEYVWINEDNPYFKTVIDTSKISVDTAEEWAKQAFTNSSIELISNKRSGCSLKITGVSDNGIEFEGWINIETWSIDSFYPV